MPVLVHGESMSPTLSDNDFLIINKMDHSYERFDIVVFKYNKDLLIKRVIGLPGETVEYKDNELYINSKKLDVPFEFEYTKDFKYEVPESEYFVLGDNRDNSKDSRYFGSIKLKAIKGKVKIILFPFKRIGKVR
jgi:signal peptidase I